jgi:hypothetical protein
MTNEEFLELARQNNAILSPEESEKSRREFREMISGMRSDWLGSMYFVNPHNPLQVFVDKCHTGLCFFSFVCILFITMIYAVIIGSIILALLITVF